MIPVVTIQQESTQSGGRVKRKPGRPRGAKDKKPRKRRAPARRKPTPFPRSRDAAIRRRREEAEVLRELGIREGDLTSPSMVREQLAARRDAEELAGRRLTAAEARRVREALDREQSDLRAERLRNREARERRLFAERAEQQRTRAELIAENAAQVVAVPVPSTRSTKSKRSSRVMPSTPGGAAASPRTPTRMPRGLGGAPGTPLARVEDDLTDIERELPLPRETRARRKAREEFERGPAGGLRGRGIAKPKKGKKEKPCACKHKEHCADHVRHACGLTMKHAEQHGRKAAKEHVAELRQMKRDLMDTMKYVRGLE